MCRKQAAAYTVVSRLPSPDEVPSFHGTSDELYFPPSQMELDEANACLFTIGQTPLTKRKIQSKTYRQQKYEQMCDKMHDLVVGDVQKTSQSDESEILTQLKGKFVTVSKSETQFYHRVGLLGKCKLNSEHRTGWLEKQNSLSKRRG